MVHCEGFPTPIARLDSVTLLLEFAKALPRESMDGPNQVEVSRDERSVRLTLTRETAHRVNADRDDLATFLRPDRFVQSDDATLKAIADSLRAATGTGGWPLARTIAAYVNRHIVHKGMEHGYDSALDVYRTRAGDCTEHSLLTVALLRAAGIPARPAVGLAYGSTEGAFVGHMWVEAYVDYWRTLDALDLALDPIRIRVHAPKPSETLGERDLMRAYSEVAGVVIRVVDERSH
jgi:transglutaminase-like putative cysteine protease